MNNDLIERLKDFFARRRSMLSVSDEKLIKETIATLSPVLPDQCEHEWIDPSNEAVDAGEYRLCLKCRSIAIPEAPVLPEDLGVVLKDAETAARNAGTGIPPNTIETRDLLCALIAIIERLAREKASEKREALNIIGDQRQRIEEYEGEDGPNYWMGLVDAAREQRDKANAQIAEYDKLCESLAALIPGFERDPDAMAAATTLKRIRGMK